MTKTIMTRRDFIALALTLGTVTVLTAQNAEAFGVKAMAKTAQQGLNHATLTGGVSKHHNSMHSYDIRETHKDPGQLTKPHRKCPGASLPGKPCRKSVS